MSEALSTAVASATKTALNTRLAAVPSAEQQGTDRFSSLLDVARNASSNASTATAAQQPAAPEPAPQRPSASRQDRPVSSRSSRDRDTTPAASDQPTQDAAAPQDAPPPATSAPSAQTDQPKGEAQETTGTVDQKESKDTKTASQDAAPAAAAVSAETLAAAAAAVITAPAPVPATTVATGEEATPTAIQTTTAATAEGASAALRDGTVLPGTPRVGRNAAPATALANDATVIPLTGDAAGTSGTTQTDVPENLSAISAAATQADTAPKASTGKTVSAPTSTKTEVSQTATTTLSDTANLQSAASKAETARTEGSVKTAGEETTRVKSGGEVPAHRDASNTIQGQPNVNPQPNAAALAQSNLVPQQIQPGVNTSTSAAIAATAPQATTTQTVEINALAVSIATKAAGGNTRFDIKLDPPELGKIDIRLQLDHEGRVKSTMVVEKQETYQLLQQDPRSLEKALQQAGVKTADGGIEFQLRDQSQFNQQGSSGNAYADQGQQQQSSSRGGWTQLVADEQSITSVDPTALRQAYAASLRGGVDVRI